MINAATTEAPRILTTSKAAHPYTNRSVKKRLYADFFGKCYLCEGLLLGSLSVEHLKPKEDFPEDENSWENLFPAHQNCNSQRLKWTDKPYMKNGKPTRWPIEGMLNPRLHDVEARLQQYIDDDGALLFAPVSGDAMAANTAQELNHIHSDRDPWGLALQLRVHRQLRRVEKRIRQLLRAEALGDRKTVQRLRAELSEKLSRKAPYAMLVRSAVIGDSLPRQHEDILD